MNEKMNGYIVGAVSEDDIGDIVDLEEMCFAFPMSEANARSFLLSENSAAFVCRETENAGKLCAYCGAICVLDEAQVLNVATDPDFRRRGLGRLVVEALIDEVRKRGVTSITLEVRESNSAARNLYEGIGFFEVGRIKKYYSKPVEDALIMKLDL